MMPAFFDKNLLFHRDYLIVGVSVNFNRWKWCIYRRININDSVNLIDFFIIRFRIDFLRLLCSGGWWAWMVIEISGHIPNPLHEVTEISSVKVMRKLPFETALTRRRNTNYPNPRFWKSEDICLGQSVSFSLISMIILFGLTNIITHRNLITWYAATIILLKTKFKLV